MNSTCLWRAGVLLCLATCALAQAPQDLVVSDFDTTKREWRSKFSAHEVVEVEREEKATRALRLSFDLSKAPHYDWFRAMIPEGIDARPYKYLAFWVKGDGNGARMIPMLMQATEKSKQYPYGEITASAGSHPIVLSFTGWRRFSAPLSVFGGLDAIADRVQMINFSLTRGSSEGRPAELLIDEVMLVTEPRGQVVEEEVRYPPADIAIKSEEEFFGLMDLELPGLQEVRKAVEARDWTAAKTAWARHLGTREEPRWVWSRRDKERIINVFGEQFGGLKRHVPAADKVLAREFSWLGVSKTLEKDVQWLQGPVEWTHVLSRFQYWKSLGYAYWATEGSKSRLEAAPTIVRTGAKYAEDFVHMLKDWIADNPVPRILTNSRGKHGTVWRTLETGIRGDLWFDVMELFMDAPEFDAEAKYLMTKSLVEHARHLHRYETGFRYGNWQVVECTGLAAIGIMLPEFKEAAGWRERAFDYLVEHMAKDVHPDGSHHELTPGYHGWVMERFLKASLLCKRNGYEVPGLMDRHEKMFEFLMHLSKPNRRCPAVGDAGASSIRGNMGLGALLYDRPDMRYLAVDKVSAGWVWLFGPDVMERYEALKGAPPAFTSSMLPDAQYCMMRTGWNKDDKCLLFDCAPWGGGHSHQDRLQVIAYAGRDLVIDPGICSYDHPLSWQYYRKSEAHNVLLIDGQEQIQSDPKLIAWSVTSEADFACGEIADEKAGLRHRRSVLFVKPDYWVVVDHVFGEGEHELTRLFHFPLVEVQSDGNCARTKFAEGQNILVAGADGGQLEMRKGWIPTGGATAEEAPVAAFVNRCKLPAALCTVLVPFDEEGQLPEIETVSAGGPLVIGLRLSFADGQEDEIAISAEPTEIRLGKHHVEARALCVRMGPRASGVSVVDGASGSGEKAAH